MASLALVERNRKLLEGAAYVLPILERELRRRRNAWKPFADPPDRVHPQRLALESPADILGYGGQAGGGKSDLLLGAARQHYRGVIFRRVFPSLGALIDRSREIYNPDNSAAALDSYNEALYRWRFEDRSQLLFRSLQYDKDVLAHQGQPRDYYGFDELTEFTEHQFRFITGWNRTTRKGQRCRVIATMNPPTTEEGTWVIKYFAPWLDDEHPNPAAPGELRWFTTLNGRDVELPDGRPFILKDGEPCYDFDLQAVPEADVLYPKSRTFIFASVRDNPILVESGYIATLQALPEPLRSILLDGNFKAGITEDPWRVVPSAWVRQAQARWKAAKQPATPMSQLGVDVARGGNDQTVLSPRYDSYYAKQQVYPGRTTKDGPQVVQAIIKAEPGDALVGIDVIGVGCSPVDFSKATFLTHALNGSEAPNENERDKSGRLRFFNKRSMWWWRFREQLDPASGNDIALPDDPELLADLTAFRWTLTPRGIKVESKDDVKDRLGRSPDKGDSIVYASAHDPVPGMGLFDFMKQKAAERKAQQQPAKVNGNGNGGGAAIMGAMRQ